MYPMSRCPNPPSPPISLHPKYSLSVTTAVDSVITHKLPASMPPLNHCPSKEFYIY